MRRRDFIAGLGAAAWPLAARAQQRTPPVIGYLDPASLETRRLFIASVQRGLSDAGFVEGRNLAAEYRWAEDHYDRLPALAADLVRRRVDVVVAMTMAAVQAAKAATNAIPIVFGIADDPVETGLVASLNRPGGNLTGITSLNIAVSVKRLELLHQLVPAASLIGILVNPANRVSAEAETTELQAAAQILGVRLLILNASDASEIEAAFATLVREGAGGLVISGDLFFAVHADQLVALEARYRVPAVHSGLIVPAAGGLVSYGTDFPDAWQIVGGYAGRILKGEKPADLPV